MHMKLLKLFVVTSLTDFFILIVVLCGGIAKYETPGIPLQAEVMNMGHYQPAAFILNLTALGIKQQTIVH